jgi:Rod binding domain-containing protein
MNVAAIAGSLSAPAAGTARPSEVPGAADRKKVAAQFEAILVRQLLSESMTKMLGEGGGAASSVYGGMLTDTIAEQMTAGPGLGLGRLIASQLTPRSPVAAQPNTP